MSEFSDEVNLKAIAVANGIVKLGERIAVSVDGAEYGGGLRMGRVLEIRAERAFGGGYKHRSVRVLVTHSSDFMVSKSYIRTYDNPQRMVRL